MSVVQNHRRKLFLSATVGTLALFLLAAGPSSAADMPVKAAGPATQSWDGFYLGADAGLRATQADWATTSFLGAPLPPFSESFNDAAFRGGLFLGYNWQFAPRWVAGAEADWGLSDKTTTQDGFLPGFTGPIFPILPGDNASVKTTWDASLRARLGYLVTPSILVYGTAGVAWQHFEISSTCSFLCAGATASASDTRAGWTIGGGIETKIAPNWLARAEYRYANFGTAHETLNYSAPIAGPANVDLKLSSSTMTFGLAYQFDPSRRSAASEAMAFAAMPTRNNWSGLEIGLTAGARSSRTNWTTVDFTPFPIVAGTNEQSFNDTAFRGGIYAGYNWQFAPRWLAGIEGDWNAAGKTTTQNGFLPGFSGVFGPIDPGDQIDVRTTWDASLRARFGYLVTPAVLIYATGGVAWQHIELTSTCGPNTCATPIVASVSSTIPGWTIGGGLEAALSGGWRARAEYRFADYGTTRDVFNFAFPLVPAIADIKLQTHTVTVGLGYTFN